MAELLFPWERQALNGDSMPEDLSLAGQLAYGNLRNLYRSYRNGYISKERASAEKLVLKRAYDRAVQAEQHSTEQTRWIARLRRDTEAAQNAFRLNPTIDAAWVLSKTVDGLLTSEEDTDG